MGGVEPPASFIKIFLNHQPLINKMNNKKLVGFLTAAIALSATMSFADVIKCKDGSVYVGTVEKIEGGIITIASASDDAGKTKIKQSEVVSISTEKPFFVRTSDKNTVLGKMTPSQTGGNVKIDGGDVIADIEIGSLSSTWLEGELSPEERTIAEVTENKWTYSLGLSLLGKTGNSESLTLGVSAEAVRKTIDDSLKFYANYNYGKTKETTGAKEWIKSADDLHCGIDYQHDISAHTFWYAREDLGFDRVKNIRFLSTSAAGVGYKLIDESDWHLSVRAGFSYRYETYKNYMQEVNWTKPDDTSAVGMDFGLHHDYTWSWGKIVTDISYTPAFEDFLGDYIATHETYVDFKVDGIDNMDVRVGMKNEYRSETTAADHLDTTYYASVIFKW